MDGTEYSVADFAGQAKKIFGTTPEAVTVAFRVAGKDKATVDDAKDIVKKFLAREVK